MQVRTIVLALLVSFISVGGAEVCQSLLRFRIAKNEKCLDYARVVNPSAFVQLPNATCYFYNVCLNATSPKNVTRVVHSYAPCVSLNKKTVSFHQKRSLIVNNSVDVPVTKQCPKFEKIDARKKVLLLRTHGSFGESPYRLLREGATSPTQMSLAEANKERKKSFKSPLFGVLNQGSLKEVHIELLDDKGRAKVRLGFEFRPQDDIREGAWFALDRLRSAWPWRVSSLRNRKFDVFSIHGAGRKNYPAVRRFHINLVSSGYCSRQKGILAVVEKTSCSFEQQNKFFPAYLYNTNIARTWAQSKQEASEFRILGVVKGKSEIYIRKSQGCK